jgi:hypothetical protein
MNRRGAVLALLGWYLMVPPIEHERLGLAKRLSKWTIAKTFDSAAACEEELAQARKEPSQKPPWLALPHDFDVKAPTAKHLESLAVVLAQCVASDDPRLAE